MCSSGFGQHRLVLKEYLIKGFALNDDLLKNAGGGNYFDELLARIRDIQSSEIESFHYISILQNYRPKAMFQCIWLTGFRNWMTF